MATGKRAPSHLGLLMVKEKKAYRPLRYFYLNGELHRSLKITRAADTIKTYNFAKGQTQTYVYSDVRKMHHKAFTTTEVAAMVNRSWRRIMGFIADGEIRAPQHVYVPDNPDRVVKYMWSEKDIMDLHAYLLTIHRGRPRKDGEITPGRTPTATELRAMIRQEAILYVKRGDEFIPTWRAE